jgi:hypothetical protein
MCSGDRQGSRVILPSCHRLGVLVDADKSENNIQRIRVAACALVALFRPLKRI